MVDIDNPTVEGLQTLLLLSQVFFAYGLGKKAYMTFCMIQIAPLAVVPLTNLDSKLCGYGSRIGSPSGGAIQKQSVPC